MRNKKRIALVTSVVMLATSGVYTLCHRTKNYSRYVNQTLNITNNDDFLICAHRGFSSLAVENTQESIILANNKEYIDYIEMDVQMTKDHQFVLSHDSIIYDENNNAIKIINYTLDELLNINFKYHANYFKTNIWTDNENILLNQRSRKLNNQIYHLISLKEAINCSNKNLLLDLKFNCNIEEYVHTLKEYLKEVDTSRIIFQSLNIRGITYLQDNSDYNCLVLISTMNDLNSTQSFNKVGIKYSLVDVDLIKDLIFSDKVIAIWTINNSIEFNNVIDNLGEYYQDIIYITNNPDIIDYKLNEKKLIKK